MCCGWQVVSAQEMVLTLGCGGADLLTLSCPHWVQYIIKGGFLYTLKASEISSRSLEAPARVSCQTRGTFEAAL